MEAIYPTTASPIKEVHQYEVVTPPETEAGVYSYVQVHGHQHQGVKELKYLYEDASSLAPTPQQERHQKSPDLARKVYEKPAKPQKAANVFIQEDQLLQETTNSYHRDIVATTDTDSYVFMQPKLPPSPRRSVTVPQELSGLSELSIDDISELNQSKAQLWLLNQMQKLVQKKIGIHSSEEGKQPSFHEAIGNQGMYGLQMRIDQHPNLPHARSTEAHDAQIPPLPPRAHHQQWSREKYRDKRTNLAVQKSPVHQVAAGIHPQADLYGTRLKPQPSGTCNNELLLLLVKMSFPEYFTIMLVWYYSYSDCNCVTNAKKKHYR